LLLALNAKSEAIATDAVIRMAVAISVSINVNPLDRKMTSGLVTFRNTAFDSEVSGLARNACGSCVSSGWTRKCQNLFSESE
jgi:hypothetical protein